MDSGIDYALVRPNSFMQNFIHYCGSMIKGGTVYLSHADGKSSFIDVADIAAVHAAILLNPQAHVGKAYTVTGPQALSAREALELIGAQIGRRIDDVAVPEEAAVASMKQMGMDECTGQAPRSFAQFAADNAAAWR